MDKNLVEIRSYNETSNTKDFHPIDWYWSNNNISSQALNNIRSEKSREFTTLLWPFSEYYHSPGNSLFLTGCPGPEFLSCQENWFVRDGLIPLLWFFRLNPQPNNISARLLLQESMTKYIPSAWRPQVGTYRVTNRPGLCSQPKKLLLSLGAGDDLCTIEGLVSRLEELVEKFGNQEIRQMSKYLLIYEKHCEEENQHRYSPQLLQKIFHYLGTENYHFINLKFFEAIDTLFDFYMISLNDKLLLADDYLVHIALKKGATNFEYLSEVSADSKATYYPLSPNHGLLIQKQASDLDQNRLNSPKLNEAERFLTVLESTLMRHSSRSYPWPKWFGEWSRIAQIDAEKRSNFSVI